jgi:hypothetical protein
MGQGTGECDREQTLQRGQGWGTNTHKWRTLRTQRGMEGRRGFRTPQAQGPSSSGPSSSSNRVVRAALTALRPRLPFGGSIMTDSRQGKRGRDGRKGGGGRGRDGGKGSVRVDTGPGIRQREAHTGAHEHAFKRQGWRGLPGSANVARHVPGTKEGCRW